MAKRLRHPLQYRPDSALLSGCSSGSLASRKPVLGASTTRACLVPPSSRKWESNGVSGNNRDKYNLK